MKSFFDDLIFDFPCGACGKIIHEKAGVIKHSPTLICSCGARLEIDSGQVKRELAKAERELEALNREFNKTFKIDLG